MTHLACVIIFLHEWLYFVLASYNCSYPYMAEKRVSYIPQSIDTNFIVVFTM